MQYRLQLPKRKSSAFVFIAIGLALISLVIVDSNTYAQSPLHPSFPFLDMAGGNVLESHQPVSTMKTCGQCHDTTFIEEHSFHAQVGYDNLSNPGETLSERPWDFSSGLYGRWNPITYGYLTTPNESIIGLSNEEWIQTIGLRHVGGGPTENDGIEMNCFLCHLSDPDNEARITAIQSGQFEWANTATMAKTGIVSIVDGSWQWNTDAFDTQGDLNPEFITIQDPSNENCGQCHGLVHDDLEVPLSSPGCFPDAWTTQITGQIISPQRLSDSGMNLEDKDELSRAWDIHAERLVECTDCHFSLNNPIYAEGQGTDSLGNLVFDPRRLDISEYLVQPLHQFARGQSAQSVVAPELKDTMRRCESCHEVENTHQWLPYTDRHMDAINCESCHIPQLYSAAFQQFDWTVIETDGLSATACRGIEGDSGTVADLVTGYTPVLLQRENIDGAIKLTPYNLVTSWFWVHGDPQRPVSKDNLSAVWLDGVTYHKDIVAVFDTDKNGSIEINELKIDTKEKENVIKVRLEALGLENPQIVSEIQPYSINHNVTNGDWATKDCQTCHSEESRINQPFQLAAYIPGGVMPEFVKDSNTIDHGELYTDENGKLFYQPFSEGDDLYILGYDSVSWIDWFGAIFFFGTFLGVVGHGGMRVWAAKRAPKHTTKTKRLYIYTFYERLWHWLQTITILILTFTGLIIHKPDMFSAFSFSGVVQLHNILAFILVANAALALFYNLVSGDIQRFIPQPKGFFNQAVEQVVFYTKGIFKNEEHPFEKTRQKRLNPLQKITYFGILNVLLPLQVITGILMWGAQRWPDATNFLGGLPFLAPFHSLVAWMFASFIVAHVYLTTTGHTPLAGIKSMINGWDEVEVHSNNKKKEEK